MTDIILQTPPPPKNDWKNRFEVITAVLVLLTVVLPFVEATRRYVPAWILWVAFSIVFCFFGWLIRAKVAATAKKWNPRLMQWRPLLIFGVLCFSILSLGLIIYITIALNEVAQLSGTRFVGRFPANMPTIIGLIEKAKDELVIVADHWAYGGFSDPKQHEQYCTAIGRAKDRGVKIFILAYGTNFHGTAIKQQIGQPYARDDDDIYENKKTPEEDYNRILHAWLSLYGSNVNLPVNSNGKYKVSDMIQLTEKLDENSKRKLSVSCEDYTIMKESVPVFTWIADKRRAIFSFYTAGGSSVLREVSFFTNDPNTVELLLEIYRGRFEASKKK